MEGVVNIIKILSLFAKVFSLPNPSYISEWETIKSQSNDQSEITFHHSLNEVPIKVYAEVKVQISNKDFIFPGMGSATADDDSDKKYGGVLTIYDASRVKVMVPNSYNHYYKGSVLYLGNSGWLGPSNISREFTEANVRVKVWLKGDFPSPDFTTSWDSISVNDDDTFKEIQHGLNDYPTFSVVQVQADNLYFEAQGSSSREEFLKSNPEHAGGVIYAFSDKSFRLWYPKAVSDGSAVTAILSTHDGWGITNLNIPNGQYRIFAWKFKDTRKKSVHLSRNELIDNNFKASPLDVDSNFLNIEVESIDGVNNGSRFYGVGSTVNDGDRGPYGGLIYAYSDSDVLFWIPNGVDGHLIEIGGIWGPNSTHQSSDSAIIRINIFTHWETEKSTIFKESVIHRNILPNSDIIWTQQLDILQCSRFCTKDLDCNSFFIHIIEELCFGYNDTIYTSGAVSNYAGMMHYFRN